MKWLRKLANHGTGTALVFARTETAWFVETVWKRAAGVLFLHGRIRPPRLLLVFRPHNPLVNRR